MDTRMTMEERQEFLAKAWVGVISIAEEGRGPLTMPVWYAYHAQGEAAQKSLPDQLLRARPDPTEL